MPISIGSGSEESVGIVSSIKSYKENGTWQQRYISNIIMKFSRWIPIMGIKNGQPAIIKRQVYAPREGLLTVISSFEQSLRRTAIKRWTETTKKTFNSEDEEKFFIRPLTGVKANHYGYAVTRGERGDSVDIWEVKAKIKDQVDEIQKKKVTGDAKRFLVGPAWAYDLFIERTYDPKKIGPEFAKYNYSVMRDPNSESSKEIWNEEDYKPAEGQAFPTKFRKYVSDSDYDLVRDYGVKESSEPSKYDLEILTKPISDTEIREIFQKNPLALTAFCDIVMPDKTIVHIDPEEAHQKFIQLDVKSEYKQLSTSENKEDTNFIPANASTNIEEAEVVSTETVEPKKSRRSAW